MNTYDISYLVGGMWKESEQIVAPSRRQAMRRLRDNDAYSHTKRQESGKVGGPWHGKFRVRLAA